MTEQITELRKRLKFEKDFARKQMAAFGDEKKKELAQKRKELSKAKKRTVEIDRLIQKIYEDIVREPSPEEMEELFQKHMRDRTANRKIKTA